MSDERVVVVVEPRPAPFPVPPHPFAVFILTLCFISGVPLVLGKTKAGSIDATLPTYAVVLWGLFLSVGSLLALLPVVARRLSVGVKLGLEQVGCVMVGSAAMLYALSIVVNVGLQRGAVSSIFIIGFGASCWWRWYQLQRLVVAATTGGR